MKIEKDGNIYRLDLGQFTGSETVDRIILEIELGRLLREASMEYIPSMRERFGEILAKKIGGRLLPKMKRDDFDPSIVY